MLSSDHKLLKKIQSRIPEFDAEQNDGSWIWTYRCCEQEEGSDTLIDCFIDFSAKNCDDIDEALGLKDED